MELAIGVQTVVNILLGLVLPLAIGVANVCNVTGTWFTFALAFVYVMANIGLFVYFRRAHPDEFSWVKHLIVPVIGSVALGIVVYYSVVPLPAWPVSLAPFIVLGWLLVGCYRAGMGIPLSDEALRLLEGRNYAVLATVNPDGSPHTSVMWVGHDGDDLLFSTVEGRVKHRNMLRDPRVSVTVIDSADPENYAELSGRASITPDVGRRLDTRLSWKYEGKDPGEDRPGAVRVVVRMVVEKATGHAR